MSTEIIRETYKTPEIYIDEREITFLDEAEIELHFRDEIEDGLSMLFVEAADGSFEGIEMSEPDRLEPISPADGDMPPNGRGWEGILAPDKPARLRISARLGRRVRVIWAQVARGFGKLMPTSCTLCKRLVKLIVKTVLPMLGCPTLPDGSWAADQIRGILANADTDMLNGRYGSFIRAVASRLGQKVWDKILQATAPVRYVIRLTDQFLTQICTMLGYCPPSTTQTGP